MRAAGKSIELVLGKLIGASASLLYFFNRVQHDLFLRPLFNQMLRTFVYNYSIYEIARVIRKIDRNNLQLISSIRNKFNSTNGIYIPFICTNNTFFMYILYVEFYKYM